MSAPYLLRGAAPTDQPAPGSDYARLRGCVCNQIDNFFGRGQKTGWSPLPGMGRPWLKCNRCAWPHEVKKRKAARRRALARIKADPELAVPPEQRPIQRPRGAAERGPELERTCLTPGCDRVVTRRKKKCSVCRQRDTEAARAQLALVQGRGRRTDLARPTPSPAPRYAHG